LENLFNNETKIGRSGRKSLMDKPSFPIQFAGGPSDALAVFGEGLIVYANEAFGKLYNPLKNKDKKRFNLKLRDLNLDLQQSGKAFAKKQITLTPHDSEVDIFVYLLNKPGSEKNCLLVLVNPANPPIDPPSFVDDQLLDSIQIQKKVSKIKLSAAFSELVGEDPHFKAVLFKAQKAAKSESTAPRSRISLSTVNYSDTKKVPSPVPHRVDDMVCLQKPIKGPFFLMKFQMHHSKPRPNCCAY
jgi:hypothetical protein